MIVTDEIQTQATRYQIGKSIFNPQYNALLFYFDQIRKLNFVSYFFSSATQK
jgi:hypothetical protein